MFKSGTFQGAGKGWFGFVSVLPRSAVGRSVDGQAIGVVTPPIGGVGGD